MPIGTRTSQLSRVPCCMSLTNTNMVLNRVSDTAEWVRTAYGTTSFSMEEGSAGNKCSQVRGKLQAPQSLLSQFTTSTFAHGVYVSSCNPWNLGGKHHSGTPFESKLEYHAAGPDYTYHAPLTTYNKRPEGARKMLPGRI